MNFDNFSIKKISTIETYPVRHPVLRAGRPLEDCKFDHDDLETTFHLGLFEKNHLIGVATFLKNNSSSFPESNQYQLRGMAVLDHFQGKGLGAQLLNYAETELKLSQAELLWFNARERAVPFYSKLGYKTT
ncbi:MAG: GNAT family N-acetyltransferase, partial [Mangrovimonas sp.]|nr:GNAT family N-acetyltransferase [Mangrovimonas sp.]